MIRGNGARLGFLEIVMALDAQKGETSIHCFLFKEIISLSLVSLSVVIPEIAAI